MPANTFFRKSPFLRIMLPNRAKVGGHRTVELMFKTGVRDQAAAQIVNLLTAEMHSGAPSGRMYADSLVRALICRYLALKLNGGVPQRAAKVTIHPRVLNHLHEWMLAHLDHDISLAALAREAKYSTTHLLRAFRTSTGVTPHQYLLELRVQRAEDLLRRRAARIIEVAAECGFSSQAHLTQIFKVRRGISPG
jgi:AraC family transcriptional regulator